MPFDELVFLFQLLSQSDDIAALNAVVVDVVAVAGGVGGEVCGRDGDDEDSNAAMRRL